MKPADVENAKRDQSTLVTQAVVGKPAAKVEALNGGAQRLGFLEGQFKVPDDFDTMFQEEIIAMFEGDGKKFV